MEVDGRWLLVEINKIENKYSQFQVALDGDVGNFQTLIKQTHD